MALQNNEDEDLKKFREDWKKELNAHHTLKKTSDVEDNNSIIGQNDIFLEKQGVLETGTQSSVRFPSQEGLFFPIDIPSSSQGPHERFANVDISSAESSRDGFPTDLQSDRNVDHDATEYYPFKILTQFLNEAPKKKKDSPLSRKSKDVPITYCKRKYFSDPSFNSQKVKKKKKVGSGKDEIIDNDQKSEIKQRYLDLFIADLDEINEIPFFDTTVAREIALKIFQHLDLKSLCMCSQVSRSWHSLADDEMLWCQISHSLGFLPNFHVSQRENWKSLVRSHLEQKRTLISNWKERVGKPYHLNFAQGGVLCAVTCTGSRILAGYTSCNVRCWDAETGDYCTLNASNTALVIDEDAQDLGLIRNEVTSICATSNITAASFKHGFVDVWYNEEVTDPIHTFSFRNSFLTSICGTDISQSESLVAASQAKQIQISKVNNTGGTIIQDFDMRNPVKKIIWYESENSTYNSQLLISCHSSVYMKSFESTISTAFSANSLQENSMIEVHNIIWAPVSCTGHRTTAHEVAVGFTLAQPTSKVKLNIYDVIAAKEKTSLSGHTWVISCMHLPDTNASALVTGSVDRKIRVFDLRAGVTPRVSLPGHSAPVTSVQMDDWKLVSGDEAGFVCVWDQRTGKKLWDVHNRHPVQYCHFEDRLLVMGNVPYQKFQEGDFEDTKSIRYRGTVQVYDFLANQMRQGIPDVCLSSYAEPEASNYNIGLAMPYDTL